MFCAHIDTVPHQGPDRGGRARKASSAVAARRSSAPTTRPRSRSSWSWSPATPQRAAAGRDRAAADRRRGAGAARGEGVRRLGAALASAASSSTTPSAIGEVIVTSPTQQRILADFSGVEAHAGIRPEDGNNAIAAAAAAIARMELGRLDERDDRQRRRDRRRHLRQRRPRPLPDHRRGAQPRLGPRGRGGGRDHRRLRLGRERARLRRRRADRGAVPRLRGAAVLAGTGAWPRRGCAAPGFEPERTATGGGSDANALIAAGFDCVLLANGTEANHTADESVSARNLDAMLEVCEGIVAAAARLRR